MPKLKESEDEKTDKLFKGIVAKNMVLCGYHTNKDLAPKMYMHINTLNYKMNDPDRFDRKELKRLFRLLKFSEEEKAQVF